MPSTEQKSRLKHVAVIGAGTVGSSCAWHLKKKGYEVTVIDPVLPGQSTSFGNAGCISSSNITPTSYPGVIRDIPGWLFDPLGPLKIRWKDFPALIPWLWRFWRSGSMDRYLWASEAQARLMKRVTADYDEILSDLNIAYMRKSRGVISIYDNHVLCKIRLMR